MKKGIIVLLIAVLVAGFAFAGTLKGSATISLGANFDEKIFGFANDATWKYSFKFEFDTTKVEIADHQTELWAEIAAEASAYVKLSNVTEKTEDTSVHGKFEGKITKANIHVGEWTFGILNAGAAVNYAKSYYKDDNGNAINNVVGGEARVVPGFTVSYKGWRGGLGFDSKWDDKAFIYNVFAHGETKAFKFGENEEFSLQAGAYIHYYNSKQELGQYPKNFGAAAKFGYEAEKLSADAAFDLQMYRVVETVSETEEKSVNYFKFEADANATYKINDNGSVGLNVYGTNLIAIYTGQEKPYAGVDSASKYAEEKGIKLDAKLWAKYDFDFESVKLSTEGSVEIRDALVEDRDLVVSAKVTFSVGKFDIWAKANKIQFSFADGNISLSAIKLSCGIKSTKIIKNAEIGLEYKNLDLAKNENSITNKGAIEAYTKIAF